MMEIGYPEGGSAPRYIVMGAVDDVDYGDAKLETSHSHGCEGSFGVVVYVAWSPPSSVTKKRMMRTGPRWGAMSARADVP